MTTYPPKYRGKQEYLLVYAELINAARHRGTLTYQEVAEIMGLPPRGHHMGAETSHLLGEISQEEHEHGRPMLSALVVSSVDGSVGSGFFGLARDLAKLQGTTPAEERRFWEQGRDAVYAAWKRVPKPPVP
jgi:hypothetical protein